MGVGFGYYRCRSPITVIKSFDNSWVVCPVSQVEERCVDVLLWPEPLQYMEKKPRKQRHDGVK